MSGGAIAVGDLVVAVRSCCNELAENAKRFGVPEIVTGLHTANVQCPHCKWLARDIAMADWENDGYGPIQWLKRIPPPDELGLIDERTDEPTKEPA